MGWIRISRLLVLCVVAAGLLQHFAVSAVNSVGVNDINAHADVDSGSELGNVTSNSSDVTSNSSAAGSSSDDDDDYTEWCSVGFPEVFASEVLRRATASARRVEAGGRPNFCPQWLEDDEFPVILTGLQCRNCETAKKYLGTRGRRIPVKARRSCAWIGLGNKKREVLRGYTYRAGPPPVVVHANGRVRVRRSDIPSILGNLHMREGCAPTYAMLHKLRKEFWGIPDWVVQLFTDGCPRCQGVLKTKNSRKKRTGTRIIKSSRFRERFQVDLIDAGCIAGKEAPFRYILVLKDHYSGFVQAVAQATKSKEETLRNIIVICLSFGFPGLLHSDNGGEFTSTLLEEVFFALICIAYSVFDICLLDT